jgi:hypothetical protein
MLSVVVVLVMMFLPVTADARWSEVRQGTALVGETRPTADRVLREEQAPTHEALFRSGPVMFLQNAGQWDDDALFQVWGGSVGTMWLARDAIWITVLEPEESVTRVDRALDHRLGWPAEDREDPTPRRGVNIKLSFVGANPQPHIESFDRLDTVVSYFYGNDPEQWKPDVPVWAGVRYVDLYPGINLEFTNQDGHMVQRLTAQPEADLTAVKLRVEGADSVVVIDDQLRLSTAEVTLDMPLLHAVGSIGKTMVQPAGIRDFAISGPFATLTPAYHSPADNPADLLYGTFLGGSMYDSGWGIAVDGSDSAYVIGETESSDFPIMPGAFDPSYNGGSQDVFVAKLNSDGSGLIYATFLGGSHLDYVEAITVGETGSAYLTGWTWSSDFPTTPAAFDPTFNNYVDAYVVKLNPTGSALVYATFLGGFGEDGGTGIAVDGVGSAYVTGHTGSSDFPTTPGAFDPTFNGGDFYYYDAFIAKLDPAGSALVYATFLGGSGGGDIGLAIALHGAGRVYVAGSTSSSDFPTTLGAFDRIFNGGDYLGTDAFVARLNPDGNALVYSTFLGGSSDDKGTAIAVDGVGRAYVTGSTSSSDFPSTPGAFDTTFNGGDAYVSKLNSDGSALAYSTFLGGSDIDEGSGIAVDVVGNAYVTGDTFSSDFPTTPNAFDPTYNVLLLQHADAYMAKLDPTGSALAYATFLGGVGPELSDAIALDEAGNVYLMGSTGSDDFPTSLGAFDPTYNGDWDAFVVKLAAGGSQPCCDFDDDGMVDVDDIIIIADLWGQEIGEPYDQNDDGWITIIDVQRVARWWGWAVP